MGLLGKKREGMTKGAKAVAQERQAPRQVKCLNVAYHDDKEKQPFIRFNFRVVIGEKQLRVFDWNMNEIRVPASDEMIDWSAPPKSAKISAPITMEVLDPEGNVVCVTNVSHTPQYQVFSEGRGSNFHIKGFNFQFLQNVDNAWLPKAVFGKSKDEKGMFTLFQQMVDSPKAYWLDGEKPTVEQIQEEDRLRTLRRKQAVREKIARQFGEEFAPDETEKVPAGDGGPEGVEDGDLGQF